MSNFKMCDLITRFLFRFKEKWKAHSLSTSKILLSLEARIMFCSTIFIGCDKNLILRNSILNFIGSSFSGFFLLKAGKISKERLFDPKSFLA